MFKIQHLDIAQSTNALLKQQAKEGAEDRTVLIASQQTNGHGQYGRTFCSPLGGLYMSVLFRIPTPGEEILGLTRAVGEAAAAAVFSLSGMKPDIKLPNDLLINGKKLCGILVESFTVDGEMAIVIGLGLNVNTRAQDFDPALADVAVSLQMLTGKTYSLDAAAQFILTELQKIEVLNVGENK